MDRSSAVYWFDSLCHNQFHLDHKRVFVATPKNHLFDIYARQLRCSAYWVCFDDRTIWVFCDFFTPKRFEPRPSFFSMSKYRNSRRDSKNFKFFPPQVFQIFDSKHGSPEDYSDFFFCFSFSSSRSRAMRSPRHNFSKILSNRNEILQTWSEVNVVVPNTFWVHSVEGCRSWGTSK